MRSRTLLGAALAAGLVLAFGAAVSQEGAPVKIVAAYDTPIPFASPMENFVIPSTERITEAARELAKF